LSGGDFKGAGKNFPVAAPLYKRSKWYRQRFLVECSKEIIIQRYIKDWIGRSRAPYDTRITIDVDPYNFI
jgi:primosomal protein N'